ncbi:hypothetical protein BSKO_00170 [Bryopsis sp. KO-2023]|nr:hypothetical protein BSKO_00170 [Bryopsis sp. KO-2023]
MEFLSLQRCLSTSLNRLGVKTTTLHRVNLVRHQWTAPAVQTRCGIVARAVVEDAEVAGSRDSDEDEASVVGKDESPLKRKRRERKEANEKILLGKSVDELQMLAESLGQPKYRGTQLHQAILKGKRDLKDANIPKVLKEKLSENGMEVGRSQIHEVRKASDGTVKFLLRLRDGLVVEAVGIPATKAKKQRLTVCVSSQVGCPLKCSFCATGKGGFSRNLDAYEIVDQVLTVQEEMKERVSNIVFMGMGEPLLNIRSVVKAHSIINKEIGIGARSITISTVGVPNAIEMLSREMMQSTLAVSLHAPNQDLREQLIPSAKSYPLDALMKDCQKYFAVTGRRVTFEYTMMSGVNDSPRQAEELCRLLGRYKLRTHVNLIPWNPAAGIPYERPSRKTLDKFMRILEKNSVGASIRVSRGLDAAAACGQLRNQFQKEAFMEFVKPAA